MSLATSNCLTWHTTSGTCISPHLVRVWVGNYIHRMLIAKDMRQPHTLKYMFGRLLLSLMPTASNSISSSLFWTSPLPGHTSSNMGGIPIEISHLNIAALRILTTNNLGLVHVRKENLIFLEGTYY